MKRILIALAAILVVFSFTGQASASNSLGNVHSEALINEDGTVSIEQTWVYDDTRVDNDATEHYINLNAGYGQTDIEHGIESISDYVVYRNGEKMEEDSNWDVSSSFDNKAGKYGVIGVGLNEIELAFGITEKTINEYTVKYKVHNVIKETTDGYKYLHWTFVPTELDPKPQKLTAEVATQDGVEIDKVYGFSYEGQVGYVEDKRDRVFAEMQGKYKSDTTLNVFTLLTDEGDTIKNTTPVNMTLEQKAEEILKGSAYDLKHFNEDHFEPVPSVTKAWWKKLLADGNILIALPFIVIPLLIILSSKFSKAARLRKNMSKEDIKKLKKDKDFYYRDEPDEVIYSSEIVRELMSPSSMNNNLVSYFVSKWTSDGVFEYLGEGENMVMFFKTEKTILFKLNRDKLSKSSKLEIDLFEAFDSLANSQRVINTGDLKKLDMVYLTMIMNIHKKKSYRELKDLGYIDSEENPQALNEAGQELIFQHAGLKNFLTQFTLINERTSSEIELWDYYFYMAAFYGIADEFKKELGNIPDLSEQEREKYNRHYGNTSTAILSSSVTQAVSSAYASHNSSSSSSGGGGGSSGGGSGGGTR